MYYIAETCGGVSYAVGNVYSALGGLNGHSACAVLYLGDGVVLSGGDNDLVSADNRVCDIFAETEANSSA